MSEYRRAKKSIEVSPGESVRILRELQEFSQNELARTTQDTHRLSEQPSKNIPLNDCLANQQCDDFQEKVWISSVFGFLALIYQITYVARPHLTCRQASQKPVEMRHYPTFLMTHQLVKSGCYSCIDE